MALFPRGIAHYIAHCGLGMIGGFFTGYGLSTGSDIYHGRSLMTLGEYATLILSDLPFVPVRQTWPTHSRIDDLILLCKASPGFMYHVRRDLSDPCYQAKMRGNNDEERAQAVDEAIRMRLAHYGLPSFDYVTMDRCGCWGCRRWTRKIPAHAPWYRHECEGLREASAGGQVQG